MDTNFKSLEGVTDLELRAFIISTVFNSVNSGQLITSRWCNFFKMQHGEEAYKLFVKTYEECCAKKIQELRGNESNF